MTATHVPPASATSGNTLSAAPSEARLRGGWLLVARAACAGGSLVALVAWLWGLPYRYAQLATVCVAAVCGDQQPTPKIAGLFQQAGLTLGFYSIFIGTVEALFAATFMVFAALIFWRRSDTVIGLLTVLLLTTFAVTQTDGSALASALPLWTIPVNLIQPVSFIALALFLYLFPDGRFVPRWTRFMVLAWALLFLVSSALLPPDFFLIVLFPFLVMSLGAQVYRYRRVATPLQRQQTRWVVFGVVVALLGSITIVLASTALNLYLAFGAWGLMASATTLYVLSALIPLSIGVSITRSHLWDLDALINKALVYGLLSVILAALYAGVILMLEMKAGRFVSQSGLGPVALVISTLLIAALVQPLRRWLQAAIDRRFYRRKYDAARTLTSFGATLRSEIELADLSERLVGVVQETMQPASVALWLRPIENS